MIDITEELEQYAKAVMPSYPNDVCSRAKAEIERLRAALQYVLEDEANLMPRATSACRAVVRRALQ